MVFRPHACPLALSASVQLTGCQSGARTSRAPAVHSSMRLPPGSYTQRPVASISLTRRSNAPGLAARRLVRPTPDVACAVSLIVVCS